MKRRGLRTRTALRKSGSSKSRKLDSTSHHKVHPGRVRLLNKRIQDGGHGPIIYWMSRDQRIDDNWALLYAQELALSQAVPLAVVFSLVSFPGAALRHYDFMLKGLQEVEIRSDSMGIPFFLTHGSPKTEIPKMLTKLDAQYLVCDFSAMGIGRDWRDHIASSISIPMAEVDTHNIVPVWKASDKQEYAARTIRPKLHRQRSGVVFTGIPYTEETSTPVAKRIAEGFYNPLEAGVCWIGKHHRYISTTHPLVNARCTPIVLFLQPIPNPSQPIQASGGLQRLQEFTEEGLDKYRARNDPCADVLSNLSPYLHYGQISPQRCVIQVEKHKKKHKEAVETFVDEVFVRRELAENYCFYNPHYDSPKGFHKWALKTLEDHKHDKRQYTYTQEEFTKAETHDDLWNAAQLEMVYLGKMHGYMRMYWAKKILEWTHDYKEAFRIALYLNDKYELDGRDPNGYVGVAWSIGGVHDQGWREREIFGKIRYMNYNGCKRKFNIQQYIAKVKAMQPS